MSRIKTLVIIGGGFFTKRLIFEIKSSDFIIAVDSAAAKLINLGIIPHLAVGDFDSPSLVTLKEIKEKVPEVKLYPEKKDFTDMHLAILEAIKLVPRKVVILSGTGSRLDHSMATVQLLDLFLKAGIPAVIKDEYNEVSLIDKKISVLKSAYYKYLSVIPFTSSAILTIEGCRYNLTGKKIKRSETRGISNEINRNICTITVIKGKVFLIRSRD